MPTEAMMTKHNPFASINIDEAVAKAAQGYRLNLYTTMSGGTSHNYLPPPVLKPTFLIVEEYRLSNFLGQYGAGRTVNTFSLLPGEKTTISVNTYKRSTATSESASSILDSYTEEKADEFESSVQAESSTKTNESKNFEYHAEAEAKASWGWGSAKVSGGVSGGSSAAREEFAKNTSSATQKQAASSSAKREVAVNTSFSSTQEEGTETAITREIQNINVGRTLNFTFRQMNQEFITLLHLVDVRVAFFNGFAESKDEVPLSQLDTLMEKYVVEGKRKEVKETILAQIRTVFDYKDQPHEVIEEVKRPGFGAYWRFRKDVVSRYEDATTGSRFDVPGVILSADTTVMRTDSLIVEALLGQADALDAYSRGLQDERVEAQRLTNRRIALDIQLEELRQRIVNDRDAEAAAIFAQVYAPAAQGGDGEDADGPGGS